MINLNFKKAPISYDVNQLYRFLNPDKGDWDWSRYIKKIYPELKKGNTKEKIRSFLTKFKKNKDKELKNKKENYKKEFTKIFETIILKFKKILELKHIKIEKIDILISLSPINPYNLEKKRFSVYWNFPIKDMIAISIHEIFHFIYYEKWKEIFPKTKIKDFEPPSLIWHLSELVVPIVLNDKEIQKVFKYSHRTYEEYNKLKINGKNINEIILELYEKRRSFSSFIKKSYNFILKYEKEIQEI
jgi:hypothetical protein